MIMNFRQEGLNEKVISGQPLVSGNPQSPVPAVKDINRAWVRLHQNRFALQQNFITKDFYCGLDGFSCTRKSRDHKIVKSMYVEHVCHRN